MIRKFVQCKNAEERLKLISATERGAWTESDVDTMMEIMGIHVDEKMAKENKLSLVVCKLLETETEEMEELKKQIFNDIEDLVDTSKYGDMSDLKAYIKTCDEVR